MKKDIKFSTRMASADREKIRALAAKAHMSMSDYVTACCLGKRIVVIDEQKELLRQFKGIGSNINRLTVLANMGKVQVFARSVHLAGQRLRRRPDKCDAGRRPSGRRIPRPAASGRTRSLRCVTVVLALCGQNIPSAGTQRHPSL